MIKNIRLQVDPLFTYSVSTQIKEQLKWLIGVGIIHPGELLPPAGQLADQLHVNRNTVTHVYNALRDEGIVSMKKGRGTQVQTGTAVEALRIKRQLMFDLLQGTKEESLRLGIDLRELFTASIAFERLFHHPLIDQKNVLFIECLEHDHLFYRTEIEKLTRTQVTALFLEEITKDPNILEEALQQTDLVVTTLNHSDEVKKLLHDKHMEVVTIGATADMPTLMDIARIEAGSKVAFVCLGNQGGRWMVERVKEAGIDHIIPLIGGTDQKSDLLHTIAQADQVYASSAVYQDTKRMAPDKVKLYPFALERSSVKLLQDFFSPE